MEYEFTTIKAAVFACMCLHNFIRRIDRNDLAQSLRDMDAVEDATEALTYALTRLEEINDGEEDHDIESIEFDFKMEPLGACGWQGLCEMSTWHFPAMTIR